MFDGVSWVHGYESTQYSVDWWARVMGQSPKESHGFERNKNKYTCYSQGERPKCYSRLDMNPDDVSS